MNRTRKADELTVSEPMNPSGFGWESWHCPDLIDRGFIFRARAPRKRRLLTCTMGMDRTGWTLSNDLCSIQGGCVPDTAQGKLVIILKLSLSLSDNFIRPAQCLRANLTNDSVLQNPLFSVSSGIKRASFVCPVVNFAAILIDHVSFA